MSPEFIFGILVAVYLILAAFTATFYVAWCHATHQKVYDDDVIGYFFFWPYWWLYHWIRYMKDDK